MRTRFPLLFSLRFDLSSRVLYHISTHISTMQEPKLTENQKKVLEALVTYIKNNGFPPTLRELMQKTGIASLRGITLQLDSLEELGYLEQRGGAARGISVDSGLLVDEPVKVPLMTSFIPAGFPMDADDYTDSSLELSVVQTRGLRSGLFAVRITGDSMIDAGINEGDIAIFHSQKNANSGDIVAAEVGGDITLKRYRIVDGYPILVPANKKYSDIKTEFRIQAKLINTIKLSEVKE